MPGGQDQEGPWWGTQWGDLGEGNRIWDEDPKKGDEMVQAFSALPPHPKGLLSALLQLLWNPHTSVFSIPSLL